MKTVCLFCGREHKKSKPQLCLAKAKIIRNHLKGVSEEDFWELYLDIELGIKLEDEARRLLRQKRLKGKKL